MVRRVSLSAQSQAIQPSQMLGTPYTCSAHSHHMHACMRAYDIYFTSPPAGVGQQMCCRIFTLQCVVHAGDRRQRTLHSRRPRYLPPPPPPPPPAHTHTHTPFPLLPPPLPATLVERLRECLLSLGRGPACVTINHLFISSSSSSSRSSSLPRAFVLCATGALLVILLSCMVFSTWCSMSRIRHQVQCDGSFRFYCY